MFLDVDIVLNGDICEIFKYVLDNEKYADCGTIKDIDGSIKSCKIIAPEKAVWVSKNEHRFEWASVMLFNCAHEANKALTPELIEIHDDLHCISWVAGSHIGDLPREWNHLVGYDAPRTDAKLIHYTQGIPAFPETIDCEYSELWHKWQRMTNYSQPWDSLMAQSIHAVHVNGKALPKFLFDLDKECPKPEYVETVKKLMGV